MAPAAGRAGGRYPGWSAPGWVGAQVIGARVVGARVVAEGGFNTVALSSVALFIATDVLRTTARLSRFKEIVNQGAGVGECEPCWVPHVCDHVHDFASRTRVVYTLVMMVHKGHQSFWLNKVSSIFNNITDAWGLSIAMGMPLLFKDKKSWFVGKDSRCANMQTVKAFAKLSSR
eukprot:3948620-Prymnesium_polylepis.1